MANYYYVTIKSDKMTQEVASKIFQKISASNLIRHFNFIEGHLNYNTRGLTDIVDILEEYGFTDEDIEVIDEFELVEKAIEMPRRSAQELIDYEKEAFEKVWLMRSKPCDIPLIEEERQRSVERILNTYDDIPREGYDDWACGFWNGVMATCRWALGDEEKDNLDT